MVCRGCLGFSIFILAACESPGEKLYSAAEKCDVAAIELLLSEKALTYRDGYGNTAAHMAAANCRDVRVVQKVVDFDPQTALSQNNRGATPLSLAFGVDDYEKVAYLLEIGSEVPHYEHDQHGCYGLIEVAAVNSSESTIRLLLDHGADVTAASFYAVLSYSDAPTLALLMSRLHPIILNTPDPLGRYPLEIAINRKEPEVIRVLLEAGARTDIRFANGKTPLEHARERGDTELVAIIEGFIAQK